MNRRVGNGNLSDAGRSSFSFMTRNNASSNVSWTVLRSRFKYLAEMAFWQRLVTTEVYRLVLLPLLHASSTRARTSLLDLRKRVFQRYTLTHPGGFVGCFTLF